MAESGVSVCAVGNSRVSPGNANARSGLSGVVAQVVNATDRLSHRFRLLRTHAEGALGFVSVAHDEKLRRDVAIKEIKPQFADDPVTCGRFMLEAEVTQALDHPGIAPVYDIGHREDGRPFYAMRFVAGQSFKQGIEQFHHVTSPEVSEGQVLERNPANSGESSHPRARRARDFYSSEFRKLLGRLIDVCHTMQFAHRRGVLHCDLKPSNIMLGQHGETVVVDWGLAKIAGRDETAQQQQVAERSLPETDCCSTTQAGAIVGTPAYMSPEQAAGNRDNLGPETDVYGLGATLYHLLTGRPPLAKQALPILLVQAQQGRFLPPRQVNRAIPRPLEAICRKAMALRPEDRYHSAEELADELEQWLADEPIQAYDEGQLVKSARWIRHHMGTYTLCMLVLLSFLIVPLAARCGQLQRRNREVEMQYELLRTEQMRTPLPAESPAVMSTALVERPRM